MCLSLCVSLSRAWLQFHAMERVERAEFLKRLQLAEQHYVQHTRTRLLQAWRVSLHLRGLHCRAQQCMDYHWPAVASSGQQWSVVVSLDPWVVVSTQ